MSVHHRLRMSAVGGGGAAPSFIGVATGSGSSSANVTPHASTASGDLLVAVVQSLDSDASNTVTWPSGFTQIFNKTNNAGAAYFGVAVAVKVATGSEGSLSFTFNGFTDAGVSIITSRGQRASSPVAAYGSIVTTGFFVSSIAPTSISPGKAALLLGFAAGQDAAATWTAPGSMTEIYDFDSGRSGGNRCTAAYEEVPLGATGERTFTFSKSDTLGGILVAVE